MRCPRCKNYPATCTCYGPYKNSGGYAPTRTFGKPPQADDKPCAICGTATDGKTVWNNQYVCRRCRPS